MTVRHQEIIDRIEHMYLDIEGNINFPNSYDGDVLQIAYKSAKAALHPQLDDNQQIVLEWLKNGTATAPFLAVFNLVTKRESEWHDLSNVSIASYELDRKKQAEVLLILAQSILKQEESD